MLFVYIFTCFLYYVEAYKILVVFPMPARSHGVLADALVEILLRAGHEVTQISPFPKQVNNTNHRYIAVNYQLELGDRYNVDNTMKGAVNLNDAIPFSRLMTHLNQIIIENELVQNLLHNENFDVVVMEWLFSDLLAGYAAVFDCPLIWLSSMEPHSAIVGLVDESFNPAYTPTIFSRNLPPLNLMQRAEELWEQTRCAVFREFEHTPQEEKIYHSHLAPIISQRRSKVPSFDTVRYNASLVLGNSHVSLGKSMRLPQMYKQIGGYHVDVTVEPLNQKLQSIMEKSKHGVIYFSIGSTLQSKDLSPNLKTRLLRIFGELDHTVIWKFEGDMPNVPKNVHLVKWAPQRSVLAHPNCILFITHGGLLSITEAVHFGVPMVGIPVFADQFMNVARVAKIGLGKEVKLSYDMAGELKSALLEVLSNPSYRRVAKELSFIYHHRPLPPGAELVHWVEHVVKTRGALHLRSPALMLPWYQKMFIDLVIVILVTVAIFVIVTKRFIARSKKLKKA